MCMTQVQQASAILLLYTCHKLSQLLWSAAAGPRLAGIFTQGLALRAHPSFLSFPQQLSNPTEHLHGTREPIVERHFYASPVPFRLPILQALADWLVELARELRAMAPWHNRKSPGFFVLVLQNKWPWKINGQGPRRVRTQQIQMDNRRTVPKSLNFNMSHRGQVTWSWKIVL